MKRMNKVKNVIVAKVMGGMVAGLGGTCRNGTSDSICTESGSDLYL